MGGATDVQSGSVSAGPQGGDGGGDEHPGGGADVRAAPGKMLAYSLPPGYRRQSAPRPPSLRQAQEEPYTGVIDRILEKDHNAPKKQRHTAKRIYERLRDEYEFGGGYTMVKDYVREHRRQTREMFVLLSHVPGQA